MAVSNSLTKQTQKQTFSNFIMGDAIKRKINETVGGSNGQRFITSILSAVSTNASLQECEHSSIISAAFLGEALKLSPSPQLGQYYIVPFNKTIKNTDGSSYQIKVAQFQLGYKGYIQLAIRSGYYKKINVLAIKEGELIKYDPLSEELEVNLIEDDEVRENTPTIGYYAMFEYMNGFRKTMYWSKKKMLSHADKYSMAFNAQAYKKLVEGQIPQKDLWKYSSFWYKDFDGMAYKTMLRQLISKWGIMSIDMQTAMEKDMAEIKENGDYEYIENSEDDFQIIQEHNEEAIEEQPVEQQKEQKTENSNDDDEFFK
jgi:recombination protein RecT